MKPPTRQSPSSLGGRTTRRLTFEEFEPRQLLSATGLSVPGVERFLNTPDVSRPSSAASQQGGSAQAIAGAAASNAVAAIAVPGSFTGTAISTTQINLSWTTLPGATGYRLYELESGQPILIATYAATTTAAAIGGLKPGTVYSFNLVAFSGTSTAATPWISVATAGGVSCARQLRGRPVSNTQIGLSWTPASGATGYRLYDLQNGAVVLIATYGSSATSATVSGLTPGTTYQFNLVAFNGNVTAATPWISVTTTGGLSAPGSFWMPISDTQVSLSWLTSANATGYRLYEMENGTPVQIATYSLGTTSAIVNGLKAATTYQFNLVAFNGNLTAATPWISVTTTGGVTAPTNFAGAAISSTQIGLSWNASSNATGYRLYELENGTPVLIATYAATTNSATVSGLAAGTTYQFNLVAFNSSGTAATPWISVTTSGGLCLQAAFPARRLRHTDCTELDHRKRCQRLPAIRNGKWTPVLIATYGSSATSAAVSGLTAGTTYQFNLVAFNGTTTAATPWISVTTTGGLCLRAVLPARQFPTRRSP